MKFPQISQEQAASILDACYEKALHGAPGAKSCSQLAEEYLEKYPNPITAIDEFVKWQIGKCTTSGFLTSFGGIITLPVTLPANLVTVWYVQLRMIGTIAAISGCDPSDDDVQALSYICLAGGSVSKICREAGVQFTNKLTASMLKRIPGAVFTKINQKVGFRFVTKAGSKGIVNMAKLIPLAGGIVGGGIDYVGTKVMADRAIKTFLWKNYD